MTSANQEQCWECFGTGDLYHGCSLCGGSGDLTPRLLQVFESLLDSPPEARTCNHTDLRLYSTAIVRCTGQLAQIALQPGLKTYRLYFDLEGES